MAWQSKNMKKYIFLFVTLLFVPFFVFGQETTFDDNTVSQEVDFVETDTLSWEQLDKVMSTDAWSADDVVNNGVDCFDYYTFQSMQVSLDAEKDYYKPGETAHFIGKIINENDQPVVDGNVFVRVSQKNGNYQAEGNFIIDEFIAIKDIVIDANGTKSASFDWTIPESASTAEYVFDYFFSVGKKFNLGGLPFSNEIIVGNAIFDVVTDQHSFISFDRSQTKVAGEKYYHIGDWPRFDAGESVSIIQPIVNTFDKNKEVDITYELYYWDSLDEKDLLDTKDEKVNILANSSVNLKYIIPQVSESVYYLKITATSGDQKSIVNIRLVSKQERPRLNYPAITKFPLQEGEEATLFTCFHNTSGINTEGRVVVTLTDEDNKKVSQINYEGAIPSVMAADKAQFVAQKSYDRLALHAQVYDREGQLVDEYEVNYNCEDFNTCADAQSDENNTLDNMKYILFGLSIMLFIGVLIYLGIRSYKQK